MSVKEREERGENPHEQMSLKGTFEVFPFVSCKISKKKSGSKYSTLEITAEMLVGSISAKTVDLKFGFIFFCAIFCCIGLQLSRI